MHEETLSDGTTLTIDPNGRFGVEFVVSNLGNAIAHGEVWLGRMIVRRGAPGSGSGDDDNGEITLEAMVKIIDAAATTRHRVPVQKVG